MSESRKRKLNTRNSLVDADLEKAAKKRRDFIEENRLPFLECAKTGDLEGVRRFLYAGMPVDISDYSSDWGFGHPLYENEGLSSLHWAAVKGHTEIVRFLLRHGAGINLVDLLDTTPLLQAIYCDNYDTALFLLEQGAETETIDVDGVTALYVAAERNNHRLVSLLLKHGANPNFRHESYGTTPLNHAVRNMNPASVEALLQHGADVNANFTGHTPLCIAARKLDVPCVKTLLKYGADVNAKCPRGGTPLEAAAVAICDCEVEGDTRAYIEVSNQLLLNGCDIDISSTDSQWTALDYMNAYRPSLAYVIRDEIARRQQHRDAIYAFLACHKRARKTCTAPRMSPPKVPPKDPLNGSPKDPLNGSPKDPLNGPRTAPAPYSPASPLECLPEFVAPLIAKHMVAFA